jgi:uncharacterized membrane protein YhaH (DUF805 family)
LYRLNNGERISGVSAILLYVFMSFDWFAVKSFSKPNPLLIDLGGAEPGQSAWEALDVISIVLLIAIVAALAVAALRFMDAIRRPPVSVNAVVAILGIVSVLLILFRIVDPPSFGSEEIVQLGGTARLPIAFQFERTARLPMFLGLAAAAGIGFGGCRAMREEGISLADLRVRRGGALG